MLRRPASVREAAFRVLLDQMPLPQADGTVRLNLRLSIPVFGGAPGQRAPDLSWRVTTDASGAGELVAANGGDRHERVCEIRLTIGDGRQLAVRANSNPYVLAGVERRWTLDIGQASLRRGERFTLAAMLDGGPLRQTVTANPGR